MREILKKVSMPQVLWVTIDYKKWQDKQYNPMHLLMAVHNSVLHGFKKALNLVTQVVVIRLPDHN